LAFAYNVEETGDAGLQQVIKKMTQQYASVRDISDGTEKILDRPVYVIEAKPRPFSIDPPVPAFNDRVVFYVKFGAEYRRLEATGECDLTRCGILEL
jgi:hypothetical protein